MTNSRFHLVKAYDFSTNLSIPSTTVQTRSTYEYSRITSVTWGSAEEPIPSCYYDALLFSKHLSESFLRSPRESVTKIYLMNRCSLCAAYNKKATSSAVITDLAPTNIEHGYLQCQLVVTRGGPFIWSLITTALTRIMDQFLEEPERNNGS